MKALKMMMLRSQLPTKTYNTPDQKPINSKHYLKLVGKTKCQVLSIDAWRYCENSWTWNNWHKTGVKLPLSATNLTPRKLLKLMREVGLLDAQSARKLAIEDDQYNIIVVKKSTRQPLFAIEYGCHY